MNSATVDRKALTAALAVMAAVTPRRCNIPALAYCKVTANGAVVLEATDLERWATVRMDRSGSGNFTVLLPVERLKAFVRGAKGETVTLELQDGATVRMNGSQTVVGLPIEDFPVSPAPPAGVAAEFDAAELAEGLTGVLPSTSSEVVRYALTGVCLEAKAGGPVHVVASDGKRLASRRLVKARAETAFRIIVKDSELLLKLARIAGPGAVVQMGTLDGKETTRAHFTVGDTGLLMGLVEGTFPDWRAVTPVYAAPKAWTVNRAALVAGIREVLPACAENKWAVRFTVKDGTLELFARSPEAGEAHATVPVSGGPGVVQDFILNPSCVLDYLAALPKSVETVMMNAGEKGGNLGATATLWRFGKLDSYVLMTMQKEM